MSNVIKLLSGTQSNIIKKGNYGLGINAVGYGDSATTGFWQGIDPPSEGYTIYKKKPLDINGPSIFSLSGDTELIDFLNEWGASVSTISEALEWAFLDDNLMIVDQVYPDIVTNGLVLNMDFGFSGSFPRGGTNSYDLSDVQNNGELFGGSIYTTAGGGSVEFDGTDGYIGLGKDYINSGEIGSGNISYRLEAWVLFTGTPGTSTAGWSIIGNASSSGIGIQLIDSTGVRVNFGYRSTSNFNSTDILVADTWYHITCVREIGNINTTYINGSANTTNSISNLTVQATATEMQIGWAGTRITGRFMGNIGVVRLYDTYLTSTQVLSNYNVQKTRFGH